VSTVLPIVVTPRPAPEVVTMPSTGDGPSSAGSALQTVSLLMAVLSVMAISLGCLGLGRRRARNS
jgi:hypothetical protein